MIETPIILCGDTAGAYWNSSLAKMSDRYISPGKARSVLESCHASFRDAQVKALKAQCRFFAHLPERVDVLVSHDSDRRTTSNLQCHTWTSRVPDGMLVKLDIAPETVGEKRFAFYAISPELYFVQMARLVRFPELVELGYELCGNYTLAPLAKHGMVRRAPVTTPARLRAFCERNSGIAGRRQALKAVRWVLTGARSPKESQVGMSLFLPMRHGGFGVRSLELNKTISVSGPASVVLGGTYCIPDYLLPGHRIVEYDSDEFHDSKEQIERDIRKRNAYQLLGFKVLTITYPQFGDLETFAALVQGLGKEAVPRRRALTDEQAKKRRELHQWLLYGERYPRHVDVCLRDADLDGRVASDSNDDGSEPAQHEA